MIRLNKDVKGAAEWPSISVGEAHALVVRSKQQALSLIAEVTRQSLSVIISPWQNDVDLPLPNTKIVVWKYLKKYRSRAFISAFKRISHTESTVIYVVDSAVSSPQQIQPILDNTLCHCARALGKAVVVVVIDSAESTLQSTIVSPGSGYTSFHTLTGDEMNTWRVHFWFKNGHIFRDVVYQASNTAQSATMPADKFRLGRDAPKYVLAEALEKEDVLPAGWRQIENHNSILDFIEPGLDGTILLAASKRTEFHHLVEQVHALRLHAGSIWKIFVRERDRAIRISEEKILLSAGATLVLPQQLPFSRMMSLADSLTNWEFDRALPDLGGLLDKLQQLKLRGVVPAQTFFETVPAIARQQHHQGVDFTLVFAHLAQGVSAKEVLSRAHVHRYGDMITHTRDGVYIFLPACRIADANKVLFAMFQMPVSHLFSHEERATTLRSVELISEKALQAELAVPTASIDFEIKTLPQNDSMDDLHYYPMPEAAKLSSERN